MKELKYGECARHPGNSLANCPMCEHEAFKPEDVIKSMTTEEDIEEIIYQAFCLWRSPHDIKAYKKRFKTWVKQIPWVTEGKDARLRDPEYWTNLYNRIGEDIRPFTDGEIDELFKKEYGISVNHAWTAYNGHDMVKFVKSCIKKLTKTI
jgi:hypothetical protein